MNKYPDYADFGEKPIDFLALLFKYLSFWKWFLASVILCVGLALLYVNFTLPTYEVNTSILLKDDEKGGGTAEMSAFKEMGLFTEKNNVDNFLEMLNKSIITEQVVRELGLNVSYSRMATLPFLKTFGLDRFNIDLATYKEKTLYGSECPILVSLPAANTNRNFGSVTFNVLVRPYGEYEFSGEYNDRDFLVKASISDKFVNLPFGKLNIVRGQYRSTEDILIEISIQTPLSKGEQVLNSLNMELTSKTTSVVSISFNAPNQEMGRDFLVRLIDVFNRVDLSEKALMAQKTATFIDDRLIAISKDLGSVETQVENYKQSQGIADLQTQSQMFIEQTGNLSEKRLGLQTQLAIVTDIDNYINRKENRNQLLPASSGISSPGLSELITNYNKLVIQRNRLARIASSSNQAMIDINAQIESLFNTVQSSVRNERNNLQIASRDLSSKNNENSARIRALPRQEREYTEIKRQQGIKEALFLYLLQKKEEKYLNGAIVEPAAKLIDNVIPGDTPIAPRKKFILFIAMLLGLVIPVVGLKIRDLLRYKIEDREELEKISSVPILGEICKSGEMGQVIVKESNTDEFTELIRLLRINLLFIMEGSNKKVVNMVSSISGEGKTFVTINLAMSLAILEKKVLVIGLDIRKPRLAEYMNLDNKSGITMYLTGHLSKKDLIKPSGIHPNLSVISSGPIPPNPNELLAKASLDALIAELREEFDYILIDTAPVGMVSDSFSLNRLAEVNLYVVRANFTPKKYIEDATVLHKTNKLSNMYFVLNDTDLTKKSYGRKYKYGYGQTKK